MSCGYQGYEFVAHYPDSICCDGFLWDADSGDGKWLSHGGDLPCPGCNVFTWMAYHRDDLIESGMQLAYDGKSPHKLKYGGVPEEIKAHPGLLKTIKRYVWRGWYSGRKVVISEQCKHGS